MATKQLSLGSGSRGLGSKIEYSKKALAVFSAKDRNDILKIALQSEGQRWIATQLPKRFNTSYMRRSPFNHHTNQLSLRQKIRKAVFQGQTRERGQRYDFGSLRPLIMSGRMHDAALKRSKAISRAPKGNVRTTIKIPTGHAVKTKVQDLIRAMPLREVDTIANGFARNVVKMINSSTIKKTKSGRQGLARRSISGVRAQNTIRTLEGRF